MKKPNIGYYFRTKIIISETLKNDTSFPCFVEKKNFVIWVEQTMISAKFKTVS